MRLLTGAADSLPKDPPPGFEHARSLLSVLLRGVELPNSYLPQVRHEGACRVCGRRRNLTFEHIPPRAAGNSSPARGASMWDIVTSADPLEFPRQGWVPAQRGVGGYVLCQSCNTVMGHRYVKPYVAFSSQLLMYIADHFSTAGHLPGHFDLTLTGWELGDIARQGLGALMGVSISDRLVAGYPELTSIILDGEGELPADLRLGLTLVTGSSARLSSPVVQGTRDGCTLFMEVALMPLAWTLCFTGQDLLPLASTADVSHWLRYRRAEQASTGETAALPVGFVHSAVPGDYRPKGHIASGTDGPLSRSSPEGRGT